MSDLLARAQSGDRQALNDVLHQMLPDIRRHAFRYVGASDGDDVAQQILIEVARSLPSFRGDSSLRTWISRISVRVAFRHIRRRKQVLPFKPHEEPADDHMHARRMEARDRLRTLTRCLDGLSPERRMVFMLQDVEGYTAPEVAEMLEIPLGTVYGRLRDARRLVRTALEREERAPEAAMGGHP